MSDLPPTPDLAALVEELRAQLGGLRSANARLREVVVGKDELLAGKEGLLANQDTLIEAQREQLGNYADTVRLHADREQVLDLLPQRPANCRAEPRPWPCGQHHAGLAGVDLSGAR